MASAEFTSRLGKRTEQFLQRAASSGQEIRIESRGAPVRDERALGRKIMLMGLALAAVVSVSHQNERISPPSVILNGEKIAPDPYLAHLIGERPQVTAESTSVDSDLVKVLAGCSPGLKDVDVPVLLEAYRYTAGWRQNASQQTAQSLEALAQTYAEITLWAAQSGRNVELGVAAFCLAPEDWQGQLNAWDTKAINDSNGRELYQEKVMEHRHQLYSNVAQAHWELEANRSITRSLLDQGLAVKVRGDVQGWVSAIGSVGRGVADATGNRQIEFAVRGVAGVGNSGASAARGIERVGAAADTSRRVDLAGRSIADLARLGRNAERLFEGPKDQKTGRGPAKDLPSAQRFPPKSQPKATPNAAPKGAPAKQVGMSTEAKNIVLLSEAASRMGARISLVPLTGEPLPSDHPSVLATYHVDLDTARRAAQGNLAEVVHLHEYARASGMTVDFSPMYNEYARLSDAVVQREKGERSNLNRVPGPRGG